MTRAGAQPKRFTPPSISSTFCLSMRYASESLGLAQCFRCRTVLPLCTSPIWIALNLATLPLGWPFVIRGLFSSSATDRVQRSASGTAKAVALLRFRAAELGFGPDHLAGAFTHLFYEDLPPAFLRARGAIERWEYFVTGRIGGGACGCFDDFVLYMQARTVYLDAVAGGEASGGGSVEQLVILGAGFDTRCYRLDIGKTARCFEVDAPTTQALKRESLSRAGVDCSHVTFVPVDFAHSDWFQCLCDAGFDPRRRTVFIWEGCPPPPAACADYARDREISRDFRA